MNNFKGIGPYVMRQMDKPVGVDFTEFIYTSQTLHKKKSSYLEQAIFDLHTQTHSHVELTGQILFTQLTAVNRT
jgi:hypothetical protein